MTERQPTQTQIQIQEQTDKLIEIRESIKKALLEHPEGLSTDTVRHYNQALFHIQSTRESLKKMRNAL